MESCDEAEKEIIYKSAYKTYIVLNKVIPILLLLTLIANMFLNTGILAVLVPVQTVTNAIVILLALIFGIV